LGRGRARGRERARSWKKRKSAERCRNGPNDASARKPKRLLGQNKNAASKLSSASGNVRAGQRQKQRQRQPNVAQRRSARALGPRALDVPARA
jgi:hypothetical protein